MDVTRVLVLKNKFSSTLIVLLITLSYVGECSEMTKTKTIHQLIWHINRLRQMASLVEEHDLSSYFKQPNITAFVPSTECFLAFDAASYGYDMRDRTSVMSLMLYHIGSGLVKLENFQNDVTMRSKHPAGYDLRLNIFNDDNQKVYTVNGASIIVADIIASNGILHIIDTVIAPVMSSKTLHDYTMYPEMPGLQFISISRASIVNPTVKQQTNSTEYRFTSFAPDDSVLFPMPAYGQDKLFADLILLNATILAHIVPGHVNFLPTRGRIPNMDAMVGELKFTRENGQVYVSNHMVRARVTHFNIPVSNGVMHVIDNLLYFVYKNVVQTIKTTPEAQLFSTYLDKIPLSYLSLLQSLDYNFTLFIPTNDGFANLPSSIQQQFMADQQLVTDVVGTHIISSGAIDSSMWNNGMQWRTINNRTLYVKHSSGELYLEYEGIKATVIRKDIKCTNGIIHLITHVMAKSTFSILDAIKENPQLSYMKDYLSKNTELADLISTGYGMGGITVFAPSDQVMNQMSEQAKAVLDQNPSMLYDAIRGHVIQTEPISTLGYYGNVTKYSLAGTPVRIENDILGCTVTGNHIVAKVIKENMWCSNGVLHIIDNLLHVPIRNVLEEIKRHPEISFISSFLQLEAMKELSSALQADNNAFTLFLPLNTAFSSIPRSRADQLLSNNTLLQQVLKAHISSNGSRYVNELIDGDNYPAEEEVLHVARNSSHVFVINNNVRTRVMKSNIRAMNGIIHIVDSLLYYPYYTVAEMMYESEILRMFYDMIKAIPEFLEWSDNESIQMTVFAPSSKFINSVDGDKIKELKANPQMMRRIFMEHVIVGARLDSKFLRENLRDRYILQTRYGKTFTIKKTKTIMGSTIDVGYSNLQLPLDIDRDGIACSNGVIFPIDGFLDISFRSVIKEMENQEKLKASLKEILRVFPEGMKEEFEDEDRLFTIFMPADEAFLHLSYYESVKLNQLGNTTEKYELLNRHIVNGSVLSYKTLMDSRNQTIPDTDVTIKYRDSEIYLEWNGIHAKIIQANVLADNGIIHILDHVLFKAVEPTTTAAPVRTGGRSTNSATVFNPNSLFFLVLVLFCIMLVRR